MFNKISIDYANKSYPNKACILDFSRRNLLILFQLIQYQVCWTYHVVKWFQKYQIAIEIIFGC